MTFKNLFIGINLERGSINVSYRDENCKQQLHYFIEHFWVFGDLLTTGKIVVEPKIKNASYVSDGDEYGIKPPSFAINDLMPFMQIDNTRYWYYHNGTICYHSETTKLPKETTNSGSYYELRDAINIGFLPLERADIKN